MKIRKVFLLANQTSNLSDSFAYTSLKMMGMLLEFFFGDSPVLITDLKKEALDKLREHGLPDLCIPSFLGGMWDLPGREVSPVIRTSTQSTSGQRKRGRPSKVVSPECADEMRAECDGDDEEFIKKRNALYSRRLYYKKKKEKGQLGEKVQRLTEANDRLRKQNEWLEGLLSDAKFHISIPDGDVFNGFPPQSRA